jgi:hypothetical protein
MKNINLKEQLTNELKSKWYYQERKWGLKINKHSVVFDNDIKFVIKYHPTEIAQETKDIVLENDIIIDGFKEANKGDIIHFEKGEILCEEFITVEEYISGNHYTTMGYFDKNDMNDILEEILVHIANTI